MNQKENNLEELNKFLGRLSNFSGWDKSDQTDYLAYFLTTEGNLDSITATDIANIIYKLDLKPYTRLSAYLSDNATRTEGKYVKKDKGYRLSRSTFDEIERKVKNEPEKTYVSEELQKLVDTVQNPTEKTFLIETLNSYKVRSYRATVVMMWILTIYHLEKYIYEKRINEFNNALSKNPDNQNKKIGDFKDFDSLKESKLIEVARSAGIISNDLRKILEEKLGTRNTAAHPSEIEISGHKATEFLLDLLKHVLLAF